MRIFKRFFNSGEEKNNGRNRAVLSLLMDLEFEPARIRKALVCLNGIRIGKLAKERSIAAPTFYAQLQRPTNQEAIKALAERLEVEEEDLFPELKTGT